MRKEEVAVARRKMIRMRRAVVLVRRRGQALAWRTRIRVRSDCRTTKRTVRRSRLHRTFATSSYRR